MRNSFVSLTSYGEDGSVLWVGRVLLLSPLNSRTDTGGADYDLLQYMERSPEIEEVD